MNLKLDTLNKKPKLYHVAALSAGMLLVMLLLFCLGGEQEMRLSCLLLSLFFVLVTVLLIRAFFLQIRYNLYSYNTIIYFGFALFTLFISLTYLPLFFYLAGVPQDSVRSNILSGLLGSAKTYMFVTFPFLLIFSVALVVSNVSLIRHEGFRVVNLLGIVLAVLLIGGEVVIYTWDFYVSGSQTEVMIHDMLTNFVAAVYLYFECMLLGTMVAAALAARYEPAKDKDCIIILGCGIRKDGTPTPLLRGRLDRALDFARAQTEQTGKAPIFVLSGGRGPDECISEAECTRRYLAQQGVSQAQMVLEDQSTDTAENMAFSKEKILSLNPDGKVAYSTTNYHVFRAGLLARRVKLRAQGMGARSKWYFWPNASVREFVGLLTQHRVKQALILVGLIVSYVALTVLLYQFY